MAFRLSRTSSLLLLLWLGLMPAISAQNPSASIDQYLTTKARERGFNGQVIVAHADTILVDKSFVSAPDKNAPRGFPIGSVAEQFAAVTALQLEKEGKLSLDNLLCDYISDCPAPWSKITIRHLMTHSSGLPILASTSVCIDTESPSSILNLKLKLSESPLLFQPGGEFRYNPANDAFLWWIIPKVSGQSMSDYLAEHIFRPLGLKRTKFKHVNLDESDCKKATGPGNAQDTIPCLVLLPELDSTTQDLYKLQRALTSDALLPKNLTDRMFVAYVEGQGFGFKIIKEFDRKVGVQNSICGSGSLSVRNYVDDETYVVVWSPSNKNATQISRDIGSILFGKRYPLNSSSPGN